MGRLTCWQSAVTYRPTGSNRDGRAFGPLAPPDQMVWDGSVEKQSNVLRLLDETRTLGPVTGKHWESGSKVEV
jgi:hypothetical protein